MMKRLILKNNISRFDIENIKPHWYLLIGIVTMTLSHLSFSFDIMGWISMVPFLIYLSKTKGWKSKLLFLLALTIAWSTIILKIITPPLPYLFIFFYSIPIALFHFPGYILWAKFKDRKYSLFIFPAVMVVLEWIQYTFTPLGSWGVAAYTQSHSINIMQFLSIFGIAGLGFLVYWVNISITYLIVKKEKSLITLKLPIAVLITVMLFGAFRYEISKSKGGETITVATVGTDSEIGGLPLTPSEDNERDIIEIFKRTIRAASFGAKIVVWNEGAFYLEPDYEELWIDSIKQLALESKVTLVVSYVMPISIVPFQYENKSLLIDSNGKIINTYLKHEPVPGEPAIKGTNTLRTFDIEGMKLGQAICYDYDFPYLSKEYGNLNADIVAIPSSDWRGIDPLHTRMAAFRAVEQGHSILRSTRFGLSAAISPYGEMISQMSSFDNNNKIMVSQLPTKGITTGYSLIGDIFVYLCIAFILLFLVMKKKTDPDNKIILI